MERKSPMPGEIYRHFKNRLYQIVGVATHSENSERLVIYQALYGDFCMYARPYDMFMSEVDRKKYPDVKQRYRFELMGRAGEEQDDIAINSTDNVNDINNISNINDNEEIISESSLKNTTDIDVEETPNPDLLAFLDAETYEEKHKLLAFMRPRITDRLINDLAASIDVTVEDGDLETRYRSLLYCVKKMEEFEVTRLR